MEAILFGLAEARLNGDHLVGVAKRCHEVNSRPLGMGLVALIDSHSSGNIPREVLDLLPWYASAMTVRRPSRSGTFIFAWVWFIE